MRKPIHAPGPLNVSPEFKPQGNRKLVTESNSIFATVSTWLTPNTTQGNARLLAAAYNAFDSAAKKLGVNAVELAEAMQNGGIAELVEANESALPILERQALREAKSRLLPGDQAHIARDRVSAILANVRGDA